MPLPLFDQDTRAQILALDLLICLVQHAKHLHVLIHMVWVLHAHCKPFETAWQRREGFRFEVQRCTFCRNAALEKLNVLGMSVYRA